MEIIHQVIGNLIPAYNKYETYVDGADPWMGILVASAFDISSMYHSTKGKIPVRMVFGRDIVLPINHIADWR